MDYKKGPLSPALSPSEGERERHRQIALYRTLLTPWYFVWMSYQKGPPDPLPF